MSRPVGGEGFDKCPELGFCGWGSGQVLRKSSARRSPTVSAGQFLFSTTPSTPAAPGACSMVIRRSVIIPLPAELPGSVALRSRRLTAHILRLCNLRPSFVHIPTDGDQRRFFANLPGSVSRLESSPVSRASSSTSTYRRTAYTTPARPPPPFTVTRSGNTTGASSVKVKTSGDTATAGRHQRPGPHHRPSGPGTPPRP